VVNGQVILKHGRDKNVRAHHPWVFSGAVDKVKGKPLSGESVEVRTASGDLLGIGAWSPASQIQVRLWSFTDANIDRDFFGSAFNKRWLTGKHWAFHNTAQATV
jgi:Predicted SAM-dependent methyltransferases